jgi:hypothetical protein
MKIIVPPAHSQCPPAIAAPDPQDATLADVALTLVFGLV